MIPLYDIPRNTMIDVSHLKLFDDSGPITEVLFDHFDGIAAHCYHKGELFYLYSNVKVKVL